MHYLIVSGFKFLKWKENIKTFVKNTWVQEFYIFIVLSYSFLPLYQQEKKSSWLPYNMSFQWIQRDFHRTTLFFVSIYFQWTQSITKIQKTVTCLNRFGNKPTDQDKQTILPAGGKTENAVHQAQWFNILWGSMNILHWGMVDISETSTWG